MPDLGPLFWAVRLVFVAAAILLAAAVTLAVCWRVLGRKGGAQSIVADASADPVAKSS